LAGLCRRIVDVDVVGNVDEAAEMRARTVLRFVRSVVVRVMVGWSRVAAVPGVEVILPPPLMKFAVDLSAGVCVEQKISISKARLVQDCTW
jgi:hypothetical protein